MDEQGATVSHDAVIRLNYTKHSMGLRPYTVTELQELAPWTCPYCEGKATPSRDEYDVVGGKHLTYTVYFCRSCGWWNSFKFWESRSGDTIYRVDRNEPELEEFNLSRKEAELALVLQAVRRKFEDLRYVHWRTFEQAVQVMLSEKGVAAVDVSRFRGSGSDLLGVDLDGAKVAIEIKHWNFRPVALSVVDTLRGAIQRRGEADRGLIVTSGTFTQDAMNAMQLSNDEQGRQRVIPVSGMDFQDFVAWLRLRDNRDPSDILNAVKSLHFGDASSEQ